MFESALRDTKAAGSIARDMVKDMPEALGLGDEISNFSHKTRRVLFSYIKNVRRNERLQFVGVNAN